MASKNLGDFPPELLLEIFSYLPLSDLLKMWDINNYFRSVLLIDQRFIKLQKIEEFWIDASNFYGDDSISIYKDDEYTVYELEGFSSILRFMRLFNTKIVHLDIDCFCVSRRICRRTFYYVRLYLENLDALIVSSLLYDVIRLPITNRIRLLNFTSCYFSERMCNLNYYYRNLKSLYIEGSNDFENISLLIAPYFNIEVIGLTPDNFNTDMFRALTFLNPWATIMGIREDSLTTFNFTFNFL